LPPQTIFMKIITALLAGCMLTTAASAQSISTGVSFNKSTQPAIMLLLPYSESIAEGTILQKLRENGYDPETKGKAFWKQNKVNGFYTFKGVVLKEMDKQPLDLYFKVEAKGKNSDASSTIYLLVSKGEKFISPETDSDTHKAAKKFVNDFIAAAAAYKLQQDIVTQEETVKDTEKKLIKMQEK
jgi:hypothetical protein